jgi:hypothetical protein
VKRRLYVDPESGSLEDCSDSPYSWDSSFCVVLRDNEDLWQRYLEADRLCDEARRAVLDVTIREAMTDDEQKLHDAIVQLHHLHDLNTDEWMRRNDEIKAAAKQLADDNSSPTDSPNHEEVSMTPEEREAFYAFVRDTNLTSCDFCGDSGCCDPDCWKCHSPLRPENLQRLAANLATAAMLCRSWARCDEDPTWRPGCDLETPAEKAP